MQNSSDESKKSAFAVSLGRRLQQARKAAKRTQSQIPCVQKTTVSEYERGVALPGAAPLLMLAAALDVPVDWLLTGDGEPSYSRRQQAGLTEEHAQWLEWLRQIDDEERAALAKLIEHLVCFNRLRHLDEGVDEPEALSAEAGETEPPLDLSDPPWMTTPPRPEPEIDILIHEPPKRPR